jgi:class III poly(R)-hydroxyalkanoic acid synthase PhaE subunit
MSENQKQPSQNMMNDWIKNTQSFWRPATEKKTSGESSKEATDSASEREKKREKRRMEKLWASNLKAWQTLFSQGLRPENAESIFKGIQLLPELTSKLMQVGMGGVAHLQQQWMERLSKLQEMNGHDPSIKDMDREFLERWTGWYEKEIRQFFNLPQLGLTRFYQENFNHAVDKHNQFQAVLNEFLHLIYLPVEDSIKELQDQFTERAKTQALPEDSKTYYNEWVKILEGRYMKLFQSDEYIQALSKTINALNEYIRARRTFLEDALKALPIPTDTDMDELYKEIYDLKRRLRALEKETVH